MCFFQLIQAKTKTNELIIHNDSKADTSCSNTLEAVKGGGGDLLENSGWKFCKR